MPQPGVLPPPDLDDLLTFELSGELLQVNVLNGQRCRSLGGLLSLNRLSRGLPQQQAQQPAQREPPQQRAPRESAAQ